MTSIVVALAFNLMDMITGLVSALKNRNLKSNKLRDGIFKKFGFVILYAMSYLIDHYKNFIGLDIPFNVLSFVIFYVCLTEIVSILENLMKINEKIVPSKLISFFKEVEMKQNE